MTVMKEVTSETGAAVKGLDTPETSSESTVDNKDVETEAKAGMVPNAKNLYQSKPDDNGKVSWVDKYPDDLHAAAENSETARYALLVRNRKCYDGRKSLEIDSIVVQSPLLRASLGRVLQDYPGVTTNLERLTFKAPFQPFVHRWENFEAELRREQDDENKAHLQLLHQVLGNELQNDLKARKDYIENGVITYDTCWMIFEPGTTVFAIEDGQIRAAKLTNGSYSSTRCGNCYALNCQMVDWDGEEFGLGYFNLQIYEWGGTQKITQLSAFPLQYHPNLDRVRRDLIRRGKAFEALSGYHYKHYQGIAVGKGPWGPVKYNVDSRIIIDTYAWNRFNPNSQVSLNSLDNSKQRVDADDDEDESYSDIEEDFDDSDDDNCRPSTSRSGADGPNPTSLTDEQRLLCNATLKGYSLKNKKWLTFSIETVKDIKYNDTAFESLVLPNDHKELILALAESQVSNKETFDDVVQGKGKGMIMLLSGPPGVGKTLTAEAVAEVMRAPLYMMSAGDLGLSSSEVETSLSNVLEMATKWNAILLLDEADVFLEQRSSHDLERNKLVSIFLRILEYYEGILFLTTNRVDNIDAAFQSRIHVSMQYNELSAASRKHVWNNFLTASSKAGKHKFSEKDLSRLANYKMNGREIKNVLKTAQLLAKKKGSDLALEHVESILAIEKRHVIA